MLWWPVHFLKLMRRKKLQAIARHACIRMTKDLFRDLRHHHNSLFQSFMVQVEHV